MLVCEAAGHDVVIVETVGVGQSETAVAGMTDMFVLLQLPNAGDDLQAIKKGVMELADLVVINKADLDPAAATRARAQITSALRLSAGPACPRAAQVLQLSALKGTGLAEFWAAVHHLPRRCSRPAAGWRSAASSRTRPGCGNASKPACASASASTRPCARRCRADRDDVRPAAWPHRWPHAGCWT
jgi:putative protein kinase ArgK-like GTPase of G3E family